MLLRPEHREEIILQWNDNLVLVAANLYFILVMIFCNFSHVRGLPEITKRAFIPWMLVTLRQIGVKP